jgi:hypothetical protein
MFLRHYGKHCQENSWAKSAWRGDLVINSSAFLASLIHHIPLYIERISDHLRKAQSNPNKPYLILSVIHPYLIVSLIGPIPLN